ncbi:MAG: hypothetical protein JW932_19095 [Deltaproteobacteria bacterium]|nr:hypothetical protein [Deltaproteobacteria bacterium]
MKLRILLYIIIIFLISSFISIPVMAEENYCFDPDSWQEWENLSSKYPDDMDIQTLHALRLGLCAKVERGDITVQQATDIFENARNAIINKKKVEELKKKGGI